MYTSDQNTALGIHIVLPLLAIASTILRFAARSARSNPIGIDDWFVLLSTILCLSLGVTIIYGAVDGCFGVPVTTLAAEQYVCLGKILYAEPAVSFAALGFIKLGILYFYKRIFTIRYFTITSNVFITLVTMWTIGALVGELFQQWPVEANWSIPHDPSASILNYPDFLMAIASSDLALDVAILCLPIHPITKLHMSSRKKYSLLGIFALGSL
ncbi:hypothetical protein MMC10_009311 [Thelotrema lepadinum]|nr:hypothetical protein [Thelotrema lepadinum]